MENLQNLAVVAWVGRHPRVSAWMVLSLGMVILLIIEARNVGLLATQWVALIVATVLVAGLCVWIVSWEDNNEEEGEHFEDLTDSRTASTPEVIQTKE
jgi:hypothetical protein